MLASIDLLEIGLSLCLGAAALVCLFDRHVGRATNAYVAFALSLVLAWLWLGAPLLALIELVLGGLVTGASLFYALGALDARRRGLRFHVTSLRRHGPHIDTFRGPVSHRLARTLLTVAWCGMVGAVIRLVMPEMAYNPSEHPLMLVAVLLVGLAMGAFALHRHRLRRLLAFNVLGSGVFLLVVGLAGTAEGSQALVGVGLLVASLGSLLGAVLIRELNAHEDEASQEQAGAPGRPG
ncbi:MULTISPECIES: hypothetical protein [unclassified Halomonas]|uniref:hypothetical protein n=1 Tax=unclassified Halomonas TaxID=2609666 RepID=UPI0020767595|nr:MULTISPECIES: hypothetical protein [unclassified Halomonas]